MEEDNDKQEVVTEEKDDKNSETETSAGKEQKSHRQTLSDEEQLAILEGRAKRLKTKLGIKDEPAQASPSSDLVEKTYLRAAGISAEDEIDLALSTAKKWGMPLDKLVDDEDFKAKLEKLRTQKSNDAATSGLKKGAPGSKDANTTPEFYIARGTPPTPAEIPDRKTRADIVRKMTAAGKNAGKKFYND